MTTDGDTLSADTINIAWDSEHPEHYWGDSTQLILIHGGHTTTIRKNKVVKVEEKRLDDGTEEMLVVAGGSVILLLGAYLLHALHLQ